MKTTSQKIKPITATVIADGPIEVTCTVKDDVNIIKVTRLPRDDAERSLFAHYDDLKKFVVDTVLAGITRGPALNLKDVTSNVNERKHVRDASDIEKE